MRPRDQQRFAAIIVEFIERCGIEPPFHLVAIGANGAVCVSHYRDGRRWGLRLERARLSWPVLILCRLTLPFGPISGVVQTDLACDDTVPLRVLR